MFVILILLLLALLCAVNYYIARNLYNGIKAKFSGFKFWVLVVLFAVMTVIMLSGLLISSLSIPVFVKDTLGIIGACWMGVFLYLLFYTVQADVLTLLFRLFKLKFVKNSLYRFILSVVIVVCTILTSAYGIYHARDIKHISYEIKLADKVDVSDMNIVMISDVHLGAVGSESRLEEIVSEINSLKPDIVCIAGDFFDTDFRAIRNAEKAAETLQKINATYGTYACLGNHDAGSTADDMVSFLEKSNIRALTDEYVIIDERLVLIGRLDASPIGTYGYAERKKLSSYYQCEDETLPVIVLDHNPIDVESYANETDLILSGHTHRGQLFPAGIITNLMFTVDYGYYQKDENSPHVIVTSGIGYWGIPMRVGTDSEIVSIKITK